MIRTWIFFLVAIVTANANEIEVRLQTASHVKPLYMTYFQNDASESDWRYLEELREVLAFDLEIGGCCSLLKNSQELESSIRWPDPRKEFNLSNWKKEKISHVIAAFGSSKSLQLTVFNIEQGTSKRYPEIELSGKLEEDRSKIHIFSDQFHKDVFEVHGVACQKIIYAEKTFDASGKWRSDIFVSDADGMNVRQITQNFGFCTTPVFLPQNSDMFLFESHKEGQSKIYQSSLSNPNPTPCIQLRGNQILPAIHPNGQLLAFVTDIAGRPDLFLYPLHAKGKARQLFSAPRSTQASPSFSPDGKKVAFVSDKDGPARIYELEIPSTKETKRVKPILLTQKNRENTSPSWSPDGKKIAYSTKVDGVRQIWIYDFDTKEEIPLTTGGQNKENPAWAPNSQHLIYNTAEENDEQLFIIHIGKKEPIQISKGDGLKRFASWSKTLFLK